jgi:hypothetical protein
MDRAFKSPLPRKLTTNSFLWFVVDKEGNIFNHSAQQNFDEKEANAILNDYIKDAEETGELDEEFYGNELKVMSFSLKPEVG